MSMTHDPDKRDDESYIEEPQWLDDTNGSFYKINVGKETPEGKVTKTVWIYLIEDESLDDGTIAMDVTERVERDMKGESHKYRDT